LVIRDITLIILLVQLIIVGMAFLLQLMDKQENHIKHLFPDSMKSFGVYYLSGFILFLALLGLFGLIGACCGWMRDESSNDNATCPSCACYGCYFVPLNCHDCNANGGGGNAGAFLLIIVVIFAIVGVFVGVILTGIILRKIIKRHTNKLWLRQEAKKYIVKDFQGRRDELINAQIRRPIAESSGHTEISTNKTQVVESITIKPSAPLRESSITTYDAL